MYVCICNAVTDRDIRGAVALGVRTLGDLAAALGVATHCGRCAECAHRVVNEAVRAAEPAPAGGDD